MVNHSQVWREKERSHSCIEERRKLRGAVWKKVNWRKARVWGCGNFSLAGLLLSKEKNLPFSCWSSKVSSMDGTFMRAPPSGLPNFILNEVFFLYFHR